MYQCITLGFCSVNAWQLTENQHSLPVSLPTLVYTSQTNSDKLRLWSFWRQFVTRAAIGRQLPYHQAQDQWGAASHLPVCDRTGILQNTENFILFGIWGKSIDRKPTLETSYLLSQISGEKFNWGQPAEGHKFTFHRYLLNTWIWISALFLVCQ